MRLTFMLQVPTSVGQPSGDGASILDISLARRGPVVQLLPHEEALVLRSPAYHGKQWLPPGHWIIG